MKFNLPTPYQPRYLYTLIKGSGDRTKNLILGSGMMAISNLVIIVTRIGLISLLTRIYTKDEFGLWVSITAITAVMTSSDFGIGYALRNKLVECRVKENGDNKAREYFLSVIYFFLTIAIIISFLLFFFRNHIPYDHLFKTNNLSLKTQGRTILLGIQTLLLLSIPVGIGSTMFFAYQENKIAASFNLAISILGSLSIVITTLLHQSIAVTTVLYFLTNLICVTASTLYFIYRRKWNIFHINIKLIIPQIWILLSQGAFFTIMQISSGFLFNSLTLISTSQISLSAASEMNLVQKLYALGISIFLSFYNPLWAGFADAVNRNDWNWCKTTILRAFYVTSPIVILAIFVLTFYGNYFLKALAGTNYEGHKLLLLFMGAWTLFYLLYIIPNAFLTAAGKTRMSTLLSALCAIFIFQTASYFAQKYGNIGITVISALMFFLLALAAYIQSFYLIRRNSYNKF